MEPSKFSGAVHVALMPCLSSGSRCVMELWIPLPQVMWETELPSKLKLPTWVSLKSKNQLLIMNLMNLKTEVTRRNSLWSNLFEPWFINGMIYFVISECSKVETDELRLKSWDSRAKHKSEKSKVETSGLRPKSWGIWTQDQSIKSEKSDVETSVLRLKSRDSKAET